MGNLGLIGVFLLSKYISKINPEIGILLSKINPDPKNPFAYKKKRVHRYLARPGMTKLLLFPNQ